MTRTLLFAFIIFICACQKKEEMIGATQITKWQYGKNGAISITYDDGSINQFKQALPVMNRLEIPATFFIITGQIPGSQYQGKFIGRPVKEIISETAKTPTNQENFFERASAAGFLGYEGTVEYHTRAGGLYEAGKTEEAYQVMDELYRKVRNGEIKPGNTNKNEVAEAAGTTWDDIRKYAAQGHEFASHTVTHPRLAVLDEVNMLYELEKSKEDIKNQMGEAYTFSAEGPYGTENERVMEYMYKIYPAMRNRMPEPYLEELNRGSKTQPGTAGKEYAQWQRGILSQTPLDLMKSWVDTTASRQDTWLVLVIHGVDGIGWEAIPHERLDEYFQYMKSKDDQLWIATFGDVAKYMRERKNAQVQANEKNGRIEVTLTHSLDKEMYTVPLTLKTYVSSGWQTVKVQQGEKTQQVQVAKDDKGSYVLYQVTPNKGPIELAEV